MFCQVLPPKSSIVELCFFFFCFCFFHPLRLLIVIMSASSRGALRHRQSRRKTPFAACNLGGGGGGLKGSHKEEAAANYLQGSKDDEREGDNDLFSPNYSTGNLFCHGLLVSSFWRFILFLWVFEMCLFIYFTLCPNIHFFFFLSLAWFGYPNVAPDFKSKPQNCLTRVLCFTAERVICVAFKVTAFVLP